MIYFKSVPIDTIENGDIEKRIRNASIKSSAHLDVSSSTSYIGTEKKFFGHETENYLMITRIRGPIEKYFPKLIMKFDKKQGYTVYKIRFSLFTTFLFGLITFLVLSFITASINAKQFGLEGIGTLLVVTIIILLTMLEIKLSKRVINKTLQFKQ